MPSAIHAILALSLAAQPAPDRGATAPAPIRIGLYGTFSLPNNGPAMRDGTRLGVRALNEQGGVLGRQVVLVERDDGGDPSRGVDAVRDLIDREGVVALVGPSLTVVAAATSAVVNARRIPELIAGATGNPVNELLEAGTDSFVFRFSLSDRIQAVMIAREAIEVRRRARPAILHEATPFGEQGRDRLVEALRLRGVAAAYVGGVGARGEGALERIREARAARADAILTYATSGPSATIVRALETLGWRVDVVGNWALSHDGFLGAAGPAAEGVMMPQSYVEGAATGSQAERFAAGSRASTGPQAALTSPAAQAFDAVHLLALAFEQAGTTDGPRVKAALEGLRKPYDGATGRHWKPWSPIDHEGIKRGNVRMGVIRGGRVVALPPR